VIAGEEGQVGVDHVARAAGGAELSDGPRITGVEGVFGRAGEETGKEGLAGAVPPGLGDTPGRGGDPVLASGHRNRVDTATVHSRPWSADWTSRACAISPDEPPAW
jgi:hypothetical protein